MLDIRAIVYFDKQMNPNGGWGNEDNCLYLNLKSFGRDWGEFNNSYDFIEHSPCMLDNRCDIPVDEFLSMVGSTHEEAYQKLLQIMPHLKSRQPLQQSVVLKFYEELKINTIKKVTLQLWET
ncbi:hypothetical protein GJV85_08780 [Sulfurimonas aquatica]|uniref:Uncharacterized protein n=1 Tax=Sulfurimonas aquatica TaxID=2672570 RepID=A0A975GD45_9BACT|nr:hypothetical protein [Sulfurimonas aquatica]QSZ42202.1 hypothetical protein GJV85_08780 [Sulfurimonas aquatica]